jgi:hypothetical protein
MDRTQIEDSFEQCLPIQFTDIPQGMISEFPKYTVFVQTHPLSFFCFNK